MILNLTACCGNINNVKILEWESQVYSKEEIESAIKVAAEYFKKGFSGCTLTSITYAGDEKISDY